MPTTTQRNSRALDYARHVFTMVGRDTTILWKFYVKASTSPWCADPTFTIHWRRYSQALVHLMRLERSQRVYHWSCMKALLQVHPVVETFAPWRAWTTPVICATIYPSVGSLRNSWLRMHVATSESSVARNLNTQLAHRDMYLCRKCE